MLLDVCELINSVFFLYLHVIKKTISISYVNNYIMFYGLIVAFQKAILNILFVNGKIYW